MAKSPRESITLPATKWLAIRGAINSQRVGQTDDLLANAVAAIDAGDCRGGEITVWGRPSSFAAVVNRCAGDWPARVFRPLIDALAAIEARRSRAFTARQEREAEQAATEDRYQPEPEPEPTPEKPAQGVLF